ncbi:MAG: hypothetical protein IPK16_34140 [Anaerolineales bacterium]|nr:hypothetical protein [Anaerolineales bacterium]
MCTISAGPRLISEKAQEDEVVVVQVNGKVTSMLTVVLGKIRDRAGGTGAGVGKCNPWMAGQAGPLPVIVLPG